MAINRAAVTSALAATLIALDKAFTGFSDVFEAVTDTFEQDRQTLAGLTEFNFDIKWKTRVINIPTAATAVNDLYHEVKDVLVQDFITAKNEVSQLIDQLRHGGSLHEPGEPALARAVDVLQDIHTFNLRLADLIRRIGDIARIIDEIQRAVETLEPLFLQQGNVKKTVDEHYRKRSVGSK